MRSETESAAGSATTRASTVTVVATVGAIALVAVAVVVLWARLSSPQADAADGVAEPVPTSLVAGIPPAEVPAAVAEVFDAPVVGAANLDELPDGVVDECSRSMGHIEWDEGQPEIEYAIATPDAIQTSMVGSGESLDMGMGEGPDQPDRFRLTCTARHEDGGWIGEGNGFEPIFEDGPNGGGDMGGGMGGGFFCCDENGLGTATGSVRVPADATWGLQDRNGWFLAYPVDEQKFLTVMWKVREQAMGMGGPPQTTITFVDNAGVIIEEAFTGGNF